MSDRAAATVASALLEDLGVVTHDDMSNVIYNHKIRRERKKYLLSTLKEPIPGWIDNIFGPIGAGIGYASGVIRTGVYNPSASLDMVPVDLVINSIIAAAYNVGIRKHNDIPIYNYVGVYKEQSLNTFTSDESIDNARPSALYKKKNRNVFSLIRATTLSAGLDLKSPYNFNIQPSCRRLNLSAICLALHYGIAVLAAAICEKYRVNICVLLMNHGDTVFRIKRGEKIAQIVCVKIDYPRVKHTGSLSNTQRRKGRFGSSDTNIKDRVSYERTPVGDSPEKMDKEGDEGEYYFVPSSESVKPKNIPLTYSEPYLGNIYYCTYTGECLQTLHGNLITDVHLKILDSTLFVKHEEVSPSISITIENTLLQKPAQYHINRVDVKSVIVPKGSKSVSLNNVI
uniref:dUTP diphosphatase n=1 Tax=Timema tahoe TaxID=61484 RepID=A0A7R9IPF1_9NEOP|nr:unnamed protein product [Timema tahoe]